MKKFNITFTEKKKYKPMTRTVMVEANSQMAAVQIFAREFDSLKLNKELMVYLPSEKKVSIDKVVEVEEG